jgi:hypothetical protein
MCRLIITALAAAAAIATAAALALPAIGDSGQKRAANPGSSGPGLATSIACLRRHGIDAPTAPADFKRSIAADQHGPGSKALHDALAACKLGG